MPNTELLLDKAAGNQNKFHIQEKDSFQSWIRKLRKSGDIQIISPNLKTAKKRPINLTSCGTISNSHVRNKNNCQMPNTELLLDKAAGNQNKFHMQKKDSYQSWTRELRKSCDKQIISATVKTVKKDQSI